MFFITFYSYKGGVGRTSALVNVAAFLASRQRRVLIIDFDLEAPGITSYAQFFSAAGKPGVVDYVREYVDTSVAPSVSDFIFECNLGFDTEPVWVMPAGQQDGTYSTRLTAIDWQDLYSHRSGYLLFEDLKQQLKESHQFDYVLIDSRTGHTDVGGICTRQLADAVVMMFLPTVQNILGMKSVVDEIKLDLALRQKQTPLLFVPANVPYLDDEYGILAKNLEMASDLMEFEVPDVTIHHYDSMSLIDSAVFALSRPKSRLASEYGLLHDAIVSRNLDDRYAALSFLKNFRRRLVDYAGNTHQFETMLAKIGQAHLGDPEVAMGLAVAYSVLGQESAELESLNVVIENQHEAVDALLSRARLLAGRGLRDDAQRDLLAVFSSQIASARVLSSASELLRGADQNWLGLVRESPAVWNLTSEEVEIFARSIMVSVDGCRFATDLIERQISDGNFTNLMTTSDYGLALIGGGQFAKAKEHFRSLSDVSGLMSDIVVIFNWAMAEWGETGTFDRQKLSKVLDLDDHDTPYANYLQCIALCHALLGSKENALEALRSARSVITPGRTFSCWTYFYRDRLEMIGDIEVMERAIVSESVFPVFLAAARASH